MTDHAWLTGLRITVSWLGCRARHMGPSTRPGVLLANIYVSTAHASLLDPIRRAASVRPAAALLVHEHRDAPYQRTSFHLAAPLTPHPPDPRAGSDDTSSASQHSQVVAAFAEAVSAVATAAYDAFEQEVGRDDVAHRISSLNHYE